MKPGLKQAEELARKLKDNFDIIISSPLKRAKKTSEIIAKKFNKEIVFSDYLKERDPGSLSGTVWKEGEKEKGSIEYDYHPYGGESVNDVKERLQRFLEGTSKNYAGKTVLVVTHGGIVRLMYHLHGKEEIGNVGNISLHEFEL